MHITKELIVSGSQTDTVKLTQQRQRKKLKLCTDDIKGISANLSFICEFSVEKSRVPAQIVCKH